MNARKLFQALVIGGVALAAAGCGGGADGSAPPPPDSPGSQVNTTPDSGTVTPDAGVPDAGVGGGGGGPRSW